MGCVIALTADHGMNAKVAMDGTPDVIYLQDWCDAQLGAGKARVILPITDPYVVHHGALGSFATIYLPRGRAGRAVVAQAAGSSRAWKSVLTREEAARPLRAAARPHRRRRLSCRAASPCSAPPPAGTTCRAWTRRCARTAASASSACRCILNRRLPGLDTTRRLRNFDAFDLALNYAQ